MPAEDSDRQAVMLYTWRYLDLEKELEHGPDAEPAKAPTMKQAFEICSGFGWPTTTRSGVPLFPEWKKTAGPKPKPKPASRALRSCFKTGSRGLSVEW